MKRLNTGNGRIDAVDAAILLALAANARVTVADLARSVGLSSPSTAERVKRLEEVGKIRGYHADIDPVAIGLPLAVHIRVRPMPGQLQKLATLLGNLDAIVECHRVTGDDCFIATAHVASVADLEALIDKIIPFGTTNTSIIQSSPVTRRMPAIPIVS
jgi:Lrp/AsnC family transcriptional regulator, leucine-responsive regulatory protein